MTRPIDHTIDSLRTAVQLLLVGRQGAPPLHEVSRYRSCLLVEFAKPGTTLDNVRVTCEHATQWDDLTAMLLTKLETEFDERWPRATDERVVAAHAVNLASDALAAMQEYTGGYTSPTRRAELLDEATTNLGLLVVALNDAGETPVIDAELETVHLRQDLGEIAAWCLTVLPPYSEHTTAVEMVRQLVQDATSGDLAALRLQLRDLTAKHAEAVQVVAAMKDASCRIRHAVQAHADALGVDMTLAPVDALERVLEVYAIRCANSRQIHVGDRVRIDELPPGAVGVADQGDVYARSADGKTGRRIRVDFDWTGSPHVWPWSAAVDDDGYVQSCWVALLDTHDVPAEEIRRVVEENYPNGNPRYLTTIDHNPGDVLTLRDTTAGAVVVTRDKVWHRSPSGRFACIIRADGTWLRDGMAHDWATVASDEQAEVALLDVPWGRDCADDVADYERSRPQPAAPAERVAMRDLPNNTVAKIGDDLFMLRDDMGAWLRVADMWRFRFVWSRDSLAGECAVVCSVPPGATAEEIRAIVESKGSES